MSGIKSFWVGLLGVIFFIATTILGGLQFANYSHTSQFISESYAIGTPYGIELRYFGFIPSGIFITIFAFLSYRILPKSNFSRTGFLGIGIFYGLATILVSLFPCDEGCNKELINPSLSQLIHNLIGLLTYIIVPISVMILGMEARKWAKGKYVSLFGIFGGLVSIIFVGLLLADPLSKLVGLYQRIIEGSVLTWIIICAFYLKDFRKE